MHSWVLPERMFFHSCAVFSTGNFILAGNSRVSSFAIRIKGPSPLKCHVNVSKILRWVSLRILLRRLMSVWTKSVWLPLFRRWWLLWWLRRLWRLPTTQTQTKSNVKSNVKSSAKSSVKSSAKSSAKSSFEGSAEGRINGRGIESSRTVLKQTDWLSWCIYCSS